MKTNIISGHCKTLFLIALTFVGLVFFNSCNKLQEDLQPCPQGLRIRFIYDYNMEFANAFYSQVDCLTVLFYDSEGKLVKSEINTSSDLTDEFWRMEVDLIPGQYHIIAYGGLACNNASFSFTSPFQTYATYQDIKVQLNPTALTAPIGTNLHPLFYGRLDTEVEQSSTAYREVTVKMMKDTNNLRVLLQQTGSEPVNNEDYDFQITDNNTLFAWDNDLLPVPTVTYYPWTRGNAVAGELPDGSNASVAWAEFSFSRLVTAASPRLQITHKESGKKVIDIPLINYLLLLKSQQFADMGSQEFLDRESRWSMIFFLSENDYWAKTSIVINDWVVRINDIES